MMALTEIKNISLSLFKHLQRNDSDVIFKCVLNKLNLRSKIIKAYSNDSPSSALSAEVHNVSLRFLQVFYYCLIWLNILLYSWQVLWNILPDVCLGEMWMDFVNNLGNYLIPPWIFLVLLVSHMIKAWRGTRWQWQMLNYIKK